MTFSAFVRHWNGTRGLVPSALHRAIGKEALQRATAVSYRAKPLDFSDLAERLERVVA